MKINQQLKIKQNQSIVMTPQLQQAIKLLQLTNIELAEYVENAKLENPFIKEDLNIKKIEINEQKTSDVLENTKQNEDPLKRINKADGANLGIVAAAQNNAAASDCQKLVFDQFLGIMSGHVSHIDTGIVGNIKVTIYLEQPSMYYLLLDLTEIMEMLLLL